MFIQHCTVHFVQNSKFLKYIRYSEIVEAEKLGIEEMFAGSLDDIYDINNKKACHQLKIIYQN